MIEKINFDINEPEDYCNKLYYLYQLNEYLGCLKLSDEFLKKYPDDMIAKVINAMVKIQLKQPNDQSLQILQEYLTLPETLPRINVLCGAMLHYSMIKNFKTASEYADRILLEFAEKTARVYLYKAKIYETKDNAEIAIQNYQKSLAIKDESKIKEHLDSINDKGLIHFDVDINPLNITNEISATLAFDTKNKAECIDKLLKLSETYNALSLNTIVAKLIAAQPNELEYQCLHALISLKAGMTDNYIEALLDYLKKPRQLESLDVLYCLILYRLHHNDIDSALIYIEQFINKVQNNMAQTFFTLANALQKNDQNDKAIQYLIKSITLKANKYIFVTLASFYRYQCLYQESIDWCQKGLALFPDYDVLKMEYAAALRYVCDWQGEHLIQTDLLKASVEAIDKDQVPCISPFFGVITLEDSKINYEIARQYANNIARNTPKLLKPFIFERFSHCPSRRDFVAPQDERRTSKGVALQGKRKKHQLAKNENKKIKIGYVGMSFKDHPVGRMTAKMYQYHDRNQFDIYCYSLALSDKSIYNKMITANCTEFRQVYNVPSHEIAKMIYEDQIDILVDLDCYLSNNRMEIFTYKPAPIQINYLGFPGTNGGDFMDYIIADEIIIPKEQQQFYSEKVIYLPKCYQMYSDNAEIELANVSKKEFNLPNDKFIFACFNMPHKIDKRSFNCWMKILSAVPESILWLFKISDDPLVTMNIKKHAKEHAVDPSRIIFGKFAPKHIHLARIKFTDLMLDTFICNAHSTATDSLWAHVPVLTLQGKHFSSRVCSSLLNYVGLEDLIAHSEEEYIEKAIAVTKDPKLLEKYKNILEKNVMETLCNTALTVKNLESAYKAAYQHYLAGCQPTLA